MNDVVLQLNPGPGNARNSEGAFVTLAGGRILFVYTRFADNSGDHGDALLAARHSDDGGRTWSGEDRIVVANEGGQNVMSVSLLRLQDGRIALLYLRKDTDYQCLAFLRYSSDEGASFSAAQRVFHQDGYHVVNNDRMIQLASGRLVIPVALHRRRGRPMPVPKNGSTAVPGATFAAPAILFYYLSDDAGQTWWESHNSHYVCTPDGYGAQEPGVVELNNGTLWSWARFGPGRSNSPANRQWETFSADAGVTWSDLRPSQFSSPCSPMSVKRMPTGELLAVWNDHSGRYPLPSGDSRSWCRTPLACALSSDDGRTWKSHQLLESAPDHGYCYTAIHFTAEAALLAYCAGGASSKLVLDTLRVRRVELSALRL